MSMKTVRRFALALSLCVGFAHGSPAALAGVGSCGGIVDSDHDQSQCSFEYLGGPITAYEVVGGLDLNCSPRGPSSCGLGTVPLFPWLPLGRVSATWEAPQFHSVSCSPAEIPTPLSVTIYGPSTCTATNSGPEIQPGVIVTCSSWLTRGDFRFGAAGRFGCSSGP